ncbi:MAG: hypothetical protein ABIF01_05570 [Candidatus Micrarchaeota archaeon]
MVSGSAIVYTVTGLAFAAVIATSEPAVAQADSSQAQQKVVAKVGTYPNFSNYGVHGNPAVYHYTQYGQWGYAEFGKTDNGTENTLLMLSKNLGDGVTGTFLLSNNGKGKEGSIFKGVRISVPVLSGLLVGGEVNSTSSSAGTKNGSAVGVVGATQSQGTLFRGGVMHTSSMETHWAAEFRGKMIADAEATLSGKFTVKDGRVVDKGIGLQVRKGKNMVSFGRGGPDWRDTKLHYRRIMGKTIVDVHVKGKGNGIVRKPGYVGVAVVRLF